MPTPQPRESRQEFMQRCVPQLIREGKEQDEAVAICSSMYEQGKSEEPKSSDE